jgi:hypothetical protein
MTGQHKDLGFLGFSQLFNIKSRVSNFLLNNGKKLRILSPNVGWPQLLLRGVLIVGFGLAVV